MPETLPLLGRMNANTVDRGLVQHLRKHHKTVYSVILLDHHRTLFVDAGTAAGSGELPRIPGIDIDVDINGRQRPGVCRRSGPNRARHSRRQSESGWQGHYRLSRLPSQRQQIAPHLPLESGLCQYFCAAHSIHSHNADLLPRHALHTGLT